MLDVALAITIPAVAYTVINWLKALRVAIAPNAGEDRRAGVNTVVTLLVLVVALWGILWVFAQSVFGAGTPIGGHNLETLGGWDLLLAGIALAGPASVVFDFKKAFDNTDSANTAKLLPPK